jgi:phosphoserine phosphatase RsbU/P
VNVVKSPVHDADGNIIGLQGIFWDITEKRRAEEAARKANLELARSREELRLKNEQMEEDLHMAREIQQAIIPQSYPCFPKPGDPEKNALEFCHRYIPSGAVGGDFFNVLALSNTKAGVFVCDVMGHGVQSALVTAIVRALVEELTPLAMDPGQLLSQLNRDLRIILRESRTPLFTTAFYLVVDLESRVVRYANAGHPKPLVLRRSTNEVHLLNNFGKKSNPALGLFDATTYPSAEMTMGPEDVFLLFTDGLYDVSGPNEDAYDPDWLLGAVQKRLHLPVEVIFDELVAEVKGASENGALADDVCLVGMEVKL